MTQFTGADKNMGRNLQCVFGQEIALEVVDGPQEATELNWIKNCSVVAWLWRYQGAFEKCCRIGLAPRCRNSIAKYSAGEGTGFLGSFMFTASLKPLQWSQYFEWLNLIERSIPDGWRQLIEEIVGFNDGRFGPAVLDHHFLDVLACNRFEGMRREKFRMNFLLLLVDRRIAATGYLEPILIGQFAYRFETDIWIAT